MSHQLERLYRPRSVAVLGVSGRNERGGNPILRCLRAGQYEGEIYAVGRSGGEFEGLAVHPTIDDLPTVPDLVFSAVSQEATSEAMLAAARGGVPVGIIYTAGFAEMDENGAVVQEQVVSACKALGMRVVGPNCMGVLNQQWQLNLTGIADVPTGSVALISQSGNIALTLIEEIGQHDLGFSSFLSFGNQADIAVHEYIDYVAAVEQPSLIILYLESLQDGMGSEFITTCRRVSKTVPIVAIKGGVTQAGRRAATSHTAGLSGSRETFSSAFEQAGIVEVDNLDHLLAVAEAIVRCPPLKGDNIAIVGSGGGHSTVAADDVEKAGLTVSPFDEVLADRIAEHLPPWAPRRNPVDMTGGFVDDLSLFARLMEIPLAEPAFTGGLSYGLYGGYGENVVDRNGLTYVTAAPLLGELQRRLDKPIVFYTPYARVPGTAYTAMRRSGIPCLASIPAAAAALQGLRARSRAEALPDFSSEVPREPVIVQQPSESTTLPEAVSLDSLRRVGLKTVRQVVTGPWPEAAVEAAEEVGYPVVLKAQLPDVTHKSDVGGVRLGLGSADAVASAAKEMVRRLGDPPGRVVLDGFSVSEQLPPGREIILGLQRDAVFGHRLVVGAGGVMTEIIKRSAVVIPPFTETDLAAAIKRAGLDEFFGAWRGQTAIQLAWLESAMNGLLALGRANTWIDSIDINPLIVSDGELVAVDASISGDAMELRESGPPESGGGYETDRRSRIGH